MAAAARKSVIGARARLGADGTAGYRGTRALPGPPSPPEALRSGRRGHAYLEQAGAALKGRPDEQSQRGWSGPARRHHDVADHHSGEQGT